MATESKSNVIQLYSALLSRAQLAARLGMQYGDERDVYRALGYKTTLRYEDYAAQYLRQDIAKAVIDRPVNSTWQGDVQVVEMDDEKETAFEKAWKDLWRRLKLKSKFIRLDKLSTLGKYGVLLLGLDDVRNVQDWSTPVASGKRKLNFVKPLSEGSAKIGSYEMNTGNPRYGLPVLYDVTVANMEEAPSVSVRAHYSRVIHVTGEMLESEVDGVPALQAVFNRLQDLEKLIGASAEMFWRGARPGYKGKVDPDFTLTPEVKEDLKTQLDEYENNLRRFLINEGIDIEALTMQVAEPRYHVDVQLQMISAVTGIPKRILVGSERGELASSEDKGTWLELIQFRQKEYAEGQIIDPFIERCTEYGILPKIDEPYKVIWPDIFAPSEQERADIGKTRAAALQSYMNNPAAEIVVPPDIFYEYMLGLDEDDIEHVKKLHKTSVADELEQIREVLATPPAGGGGRQPAAPPAAKPKPTPSKEED